jgi:hypothetical protein
LARNMQHSPAGSWFVVYDQCSCGSGWNEVQQQQHLPAAAKVKLDKHQQQQQQQHHHRQFLPHQSMIVALHPQQQQHRGPGHIKHFSVTECGPHQQVVQGYVCVAACIAKQSFVHRPNPRTAAIHSICVAARCEPVLLPSGCPGSQQGQQQAADHPGQPAWSAQARELWNVHGGAGGTVVLLKNFVSIANTVDLWPLYLGVCKRRNGRTPVSVDSILVCPACLHGALMS